MDYRNEAHDDAMAAYDYLNEAFGSSAVDHFADDFTPEEAAAIDAAQAANRDLADATLAEPILCVNCDKPATKFPQGDDEFCDGCYAERFEQCGNCEAWVRKDEIGSRQTLPATRMDPAEYEECCSQCAPSGDDY